MNQIGLRYVLVIYLNRRSSVVVKSGTLTLCYDHALHLVELVEDGQYGAQLINTESLNGCFLL